MTMRVPHHLANKSVSAADLPSIDGIDTEAVLAAAVAQGADAGLFAAFLAAGVTAGAGASVRAGVASADSAGAASPADLVGLAAWRAGALSLRDDALARVGRLLEGDSLMESEGRPVAAAALGIGEAELADFAAHQRHDRWWWPGRDQAQGYVAAVGGFVGLGGAWTAPPRCAVTLAEEGAFAILAGTSWWRLDTDVWCSRLVQVSDPPDEWLDAVSGAGDGGGSESMRLLARGEWGATAASLVMPPQTHLAWLYVETV
jgi:hypothetical protein